MNNIAKIFDINLRQLFSRNYFNAFGPRPGGGFFHLYFNPRSGLELRPNTRIDIVFIKANIPTAIVRCNISPVLSALRIVPNKFNLPPFRHFFLDSGFRGSNAIVELQQALTLWGDFQRFLTIGYRLISFAQHSECIS